MAEPISITDPADQRVADYAGLKDAALRQRMESRAPGGSPDGADASEGMFIAEGTLVLRRLLASPYPLRSVLVTPQRLPVLHEILPEPPVPVFVAPQEVMNAVTGFNIHRGVLAIAERMPLPTPGDLLAGAKRIAVLENLNDHENLGVIFRNAAAFGLDAVLLSPGCCDPLYRRCVRVSMGHVLGIPYARVAAWPAGLSEVREAGFLLVGLTPDRDAADIRTLGLDGQPRVGFLLGAEGPGLSAAALALVGVRARIAMAPGVDSLNVANAAAVAFHEAFPAGA